MIRTYRNKIDKVYDYIVVGAGLTGATIAQQLTRQGFSVCVLEKEYFVGGNCFTKHKDGIDIHWYGAHIFRTQSKEIWDYVNKFHKFHHFMHKVIVNYKDKLFSFPINLLTLNQLNPDITAPSQAHEYLCKFENTYPEPKNLEEQAINLVGPDLYNIFIKGYTEKQWNLPCNMLPAYIIKRIPVRFTANDNYFPDNFQYQGIPDKGGYTKLIKNMLADVDVYVAAPEDAFKEMNFNKKIFYTGPIDELCGYCYGELQWRGLRFVHTKQPVDFYQAAPVVNYTSGDIPYTRIIEHKQFDPIATAHLPYTFITREYPKDWTKDNKPYYPVNTEDNNHKHCMYLDIIKKEMSYLIPCGRLGAYKYYNMDDAIAAAFELVNAETGKVVLD